jgi:hypothetical protein
MDMQIILVYCLCADLLQALHHHEDPQCQMSDAEVMTTALVAALYFGGNYERARQLLYEQRYIPSMLSKSQFSRRVHRLDGLFVTLFRLLGETFKTLSEDPIYVIDTMPVAVCDNVRIGRCQLYQDKQYRGYQASKRRYFYGVKVHLLVTKDHQPVEFFLTPGSFSDTSGLEQFDFDLPAGSWLFADAAYNFYLVEDLLAEAGITLGPDRKKNSKRPLPPWLHSLLKHFRNQVETAASLIQRLLPKSIHAVTAKGFELKVILFTLASSFNCL